ncbi:MAG TPA: hypothetical protein VGQ34_05295 [Sphingomicrobium sp.]|nr:hypothetical protein [Sphingomicrobium sp.]
MARLICRLRGHRWDVYGVTGEWEWCSRCRGRRSTNIAKPEEVGNLLTPEYMRAWEERLGEERIIHALAFLRSNGWMPGSMPPIWVWAMAFRAAEAAKPYAPNESRRSLN